MLILTADQITIPPGDRDRFIELRTQMLRDVQPVNSLQIEFFNQALRHAWTIRRCDAAERHLAIEHGIDPLLLTKDNRVDRIHRLRRQSERAYRHAVAELKKLQTDRAVRQLKQNKGLDPLPVPIDTRAYIAAARQANGLDKKQPISFPPVQAALDRVARDLYLGNTSYEAWLKAGQQREPDCARPSSNPGVL